ncbi:hypothetical protein LTS12_029206, partial [Elasticomyces elasticus]
KKQNALKSSIVSSNAFSMTVLFSRQSLAFGESWTVGMGLAHGLQKLQNNIQTAR